MKIEFKDGLIFTQIEITFRGKIKTIDNIIVDTGASHTLLSLDAVEDIGIRVEMEDELVTSYGIGGDEVSVVKKIDCVGLDGLCIENSNIDFSSFKYDDINGLLGLDLLMYTGMIIDLKNVKMYRMND